MWSDSVKGKYVLVRNTGHYSSSSSSIQEHTDTTKQARTNTNKNTGMRSNPGEATGLLSGSSAQEDWGGGGGIAWEIITKHAACFSE